MTQSLNKSLNKSFNKPKPTMKKFFALALFTASMTVPLAVFAAPTELLSNGSFEDNSLSSGNWSIFSGLTGWSAAANGVELRNNVAGTALAGVNFVELDTTKNSSISQTVSTVAGQWYALSFNYSNRPDTAVSSNGLTWTFGGTGGIAAALPAATGDHSWTQFSTLVQATGSSTGLSFAAIGTSDGFGTSLDKVSLTTAVPEPQTYALMLAGLFAVGFVARRRAKR